MRDLAMEEILSKQFKKHLGQRTFGRPSVIPPANRFPHSAHRAELERSLQPWNRGMLGSTIGGFRTPGF